MQPHGFIVVGAHAIDGVETRVPQASLLPLVEFVKETSGFSHT